MKCPVRMNTNLLWISLPLCCFLLQMSGFAAGTMQSLSLAGQDATRLLETGMPLMLSAYCWSTSRAAEGLFMVLLDDGTEPIPECHSGASFPGNRRGTLAAQSFAVGSGCAQEVHVVVRGYAKDTKRATILLRGRTAPCERCNARVLPAAASDVEGLVIGSAGLRFVPNTYATTSNACNAFAWLMHSAGFIRRVAGSGNCTW
jgi:hypothetical protein